MLARLFERRFHPSQDPPRWFNLGHRTASGAVVTEESALSTSAFFAAVRVLAESESSLPLHLYQRLPGGGKERATGRRLYNLLRFSPNPEMTAIEMRDALTGHAVTWGNAFLNIQWANDGEPLALWPLRPDRMRLERAPNGGLSYVYKLPQRYDGNERRLAPQDVLHIRGLGSNGLIGYSILSLAMQSIGLALATEEFGARFFGNGAAPGGVLVHPATLSDEANARLRKSWEEMHQGLDNAHRVAILEEGLDYKQIGLAPEESQFLETRKFQVRDVARWFRMQPHKIQDLDNATFTNIEHQGLEFVTDTLMPWLVRWEQRIWLSLLSPAEREVYYAEHLVDGLLRGDVQARYNAYNIGRNGGWLSADDIREKENMNPLPDGQGRIYLVPMNMIPADQVGADPWGAGGGGASPAPAGDDGQQRDLAQLDRLLTARQQMVRARMAQIARPADPLLPEAREWASLDDREREVRSRRSAAARRRLAHSYRRIYRDTAARLLRREIADVRKLAQKTLGTRDLPSFTLELEEFYREHEGWIRRQIAPVALAFGELTGQAAAEEVGAEEPGSELERFIQSYVNAYAARHAGMSAQQIRDVVTRALAAGEDPLAALDALFDAWPDSRAEDIAQEETNREGNAVARMIYLAAAVRKLRWMNFGDSCPYCRSLDGMTIPIQDNFLTAGQGYQPDGANAPLTSSRDVGHPPAHRGCDCMIGAA